MSAIKSLRHRSFSVHVAASTRCRTSGGAKRALAAPWGLTVTRVLSRSSDERNSMSKCTAAGAKKDASSTTSFQIEFDNVGQTFDVAHPATSKALETTIDLPLGLTLEVQEVADQKGLDEGSKAETSTAAVVKQEIVVVDVDPQGNAAASDQISPGDIIRGASAVIRTMVYPAANVMLGGIGRPSFKKVMISADGLQFDKLMDAIRSNAEVDGCVTLISEKPNTVAPAEKDPAEGAEEKPVFDPRIFE